MNQYTYKARDESGKMIKGQMESASEASLAESLRHKGYMPVSIKPLKKQDGFSSLQERFYRIKSEDLIIFNIQLANMINAGLPILNGLNIIKEQIENKKLKQIVENISQEVEAGASFSEALTRHKRVFSKTFINMVKAGEVSGNLNVVLNKLAEYAEQQEEMKQQIKGALFYPMILAFAGVVVVLFIITFVIPKFVVIFNRADVSLPLPTQVLYMGGIILKKYWYLVLMVVGIIVMSIRAYVNTPAGRTAFDQGILKLPVIGVLVRKIVISRFSRTFAALMDSGVPVLQSLEIVRDVVGNVVISRVLAVAKDRVEDGERIAVSLQGSGEFPVDMVQMVAVGEETGNIGEMLNKTADFYDKSVGYSIKKLTTLIEPLFLVIMGAVVGFIMASMLLPIFDMVKTMHG